MWLVRTIIRPRTPPSSPVNNSVKLDSVVVVIWQRMNRVFFNDVPIMTIGNFDDLVPLGVLDQLLLDDLFYRIELPSFHTIQNLTELR